MVISIVDGQSFMGQLHKISTTSFDPSLVLPGFVFLFPKGETWSSISECMENRSVAPGPPHTHSWRVLSFTPRDNPGHPVTCSTLERRAHALHTNFVALSKERANTLCEIPVSCKTRLTSRWRGYGRQPCRQGNADRRNHIRWFRITGLGGAGYDY